MAGSLKPTSVGIEGTWVVNAAVDNQSSNAVNDLFDEVRGTWSSASTFYWGASSYIDITLNQKSSIWVIGNASYLSYNKPLKVEKWDGSEWVFLQNTPTRISLDAWEKMIELESGRYKFSYTSNYRMDDEWFIESLVVTKTLILTQNGYEKFNSTTGLWEVVSTTLPTQAQFESEGMDDLSVFDRTVQIADTIPMTDDGALGAGKLFSVTMDLSSYIDFRKLEVK